MSEIGDMFSFLAGLERLKKERYGIECPECKKLQPKRNPTILLPGTCCKVDKYRDVRPRLTKEQKEALIRDIGGVPE